MLSQPKQLLMAMKTFNIGKVKENIIKKINETIASELPDVAQIMKVS